MKILFFCPRWGQKNIPWKTFLHQVKQAGYDGIEASLPLVQKEKQEIIEELENQKLKFIAQHWETVAPGLDEYSIEFEQRLRWLAGANPLFINSQTGKDYYGFEQNHQLIELSKKISAETCIPIVHETHRGKFTFAAHVTKYYLEQLDDLRITLDISQWFNTAETFLHDQQSAVELAISRTEHIHARVGFTEGPQVTDPRAPEWQEALQIHLNCWDKIIALHTKNGRKYFTITPEFGAPPYMPLLPYTRQPIVNQWEVNMFMMNLLKERYKDD